MKDLEKRYSQLIKEIGHQGLLELPEGVKKVLKAVTDLETKVRLLEEVAAALKEGVCE